MAQILWFENYQPADAPVLGGKNASLGTLLTAGLPVPPGFAVSADCYRKALADGGLAGQLDALVAAADPREPTSVAAASVLARYVALAEVPAAVRVRTNAGCPMNDRKSPQPNPLHPATRRRQSGVNGLLTKTEVRRAAIGPGLRPGPC